MNKQFEKILNVIEQYKELCKLKLSVILTKIYNKIYFLYN